VPVHIDVRDFDVSSAFILIPLLWPFVCCSDESGWDHEAGDSFLLTFLLLHRPLAAQWCYILR